MFKVKAERLGDVGKTEKGFIAQYLIISESGSKNVCRVFSKDPEKLPASGSIEVKNDFMFAV